MLGVDLVLADGRLLQLGHRTVKGVTGLDLTSLVIGSEGTLGVIVGATLRLRRLVPGRRLHDRRDVRRRAHGRRGVGRGHRVGRAAGDHGADGCRIPRPPSMPS